MLPVKLVEMLLARGAPIHRYVYVFQYLLKDEIQVIYESEQYYSNCFIIPHVKILDSG